VQEAGNASGTILRVVSVLKSFTPSNPEWRSIDISRHLGLPKSTTHRMLTTLVTSGLLQRNAKTGNYSVGRELYLMGNLYINTTDLFIVAEPVIKKLNDLVNEDVNVGILNNGFMTVIMKEETRQRLRCSIHIGVTIPAYASAMGLALLSELSDSGIDDLYPKERLRPLTPKTTATKTELKLQLKEIRKRGGVFCQPSLSGGGYEGIEGISSLIRDASGKAIAAACFTVPEFRMNPLRREQLTTLLELGTNLISYKLGYQGMDKVVHDIEELCYLWEHN
jgi:DNA-binding IclR family transcriptional regulator